MNIIDLKEEPQDIPLLAQWHHNEWSYLNPSLTLEDRIKKMEKHLSNEIIPSTFVAKEGNTILGSSALVEHDMETKRNLSPWLASVYVNTPFRNKGIGSALVMHVMEQARKHNIKKLYLFTPDASDFYKRLGWEAVNSESYQGCDVTIMEMLLIG